MSYLKTILTYHMPSEAEVDKSLLESHGFTVNLLNANMTRNEIGAPFHIQLQVPGEEAEEAVAILKQFNPQRFGSAENVRQIERELGRNLVWILALSTLAGLGVYFATPNSEPSDRITSALLGGLLIGPLLCAILGVFKRKE